MADPKYANLPGIAYDQPDVFETSDLPEVDQAAFDIGDESESVEHFSDRISRYRRIGYDVTSGDFEMAGEGEHETPQQKYQRLQHELRELMEDVSQIKQNVKADEKSDQNSVAITAKQVGNLEKQLVELKLEQVLSSEIIANLSDPQGTLQKKLLNQVESFTKTGSLSTGKKDPAPKSSGDNQLIYELHYKPEQVKFLQSAKVAEFERRIEKLESLIGHNQDKMLTLTNDTNQKHLLGMVSALSSKVSLLDPEQLDMIEGRLHIFSQKLHAISEKTPVDTADKQSKISEMYQIVKKMESLNVTLPEVVERMVALKGLHEQALQFSKTVTQLDLTQQQIQAAIKDNKKLLKEVQENFSKNMTVIKNNVTNLDSRISELKK
uniref:Dynactin subunit 2 n=1 Tax=Strigamia maritima TaxID=126957 RepID=T1J1F4_STRMM